MTEVQATIPTDISDAVLVYRKLTGQLVISLKAAVTSEEVLNAYYQHCIQAGEPERPAELVWDKATNTLDIGAAELVVPEGFDPSFDIVADDTLSGEALNSAIMDEEQLEPETNQPPAHYKGPEGVLSDEQINEEPTLNKQDLARIKGTQINASAVTAIRNNNVTKIKGSSGVTKIGTAAPSQLANTAVINRLVKEGIGARAKPQRQQHQQQRQERAPAPVVHHNERGRELLANALVGYRQHGRDGVDFINTSAAATTKLGAMLDINAHVPFEIVDAGEFASVGAFWYFIASETPDESMRYLHGQGCKAARHRMISRKVEGFNRLIAEATWAKVCCNAELKSYMTGNALRYRCFYLPEGTDMPMSTPLESWYMPILEEISYVLKEIHRSGDETLAPDFAFLERRVWNQDNVNNRQNNGNNNRRY